MMPEIWKQKWQLHQYGALATKSGVEPPTPSSSEVDDTH